MLMMLALPAAARVFRPWVMRGRAGGGALALAAALITSKIETAVLRIRRPNRRASGAAGASET